MSEDQVTSVNPTEGGYMNAVERIEKWMERQHPGVDYTVRQRTRYTAMVVETFAGVALDTSRVWVWKYDNACGWHFWC